MDSILILMDMWGFNLLPHWYSPRHKQYIQCSLCLPSLSLLQKLVLAFPPTIQMSKGKPFCDCNTMNSFGSNSLTGGGLFIHTPLCTSIVCSQIEKRNFGPVLLCYSDWKNPPPCYHSSVQPYIQCADLHENVRHIFLLILKLYPL